jgi:conjugal transfer pilus assembly protein TrbC
MNPLLTLSPTKVLPAMLLISVAHAAPPPMPHDSVLNREVAKQLPKSATSIDKADRQSRSLHQPVPDVGNVAAPLMPDPAAIAERYESIGKNDESALYVMVSFSMPPESIARLAEQASKAGATLVLRGALDNSLKKTSERAAEFIKRYPGAQFQIDPTVFRRYAIKQVPAFVLARDNEEVKACTKGCDATAFFVSVAGDVSLDYALEYIARQGGERFAPLAERRLKKMRGG